MITKNIFDVSTRVCYLRWPTIHGSCSLQTCYAATARHSVCS